MHESAKGKNGGELSDSGVLRGKAREKRRKRKKRRVNRNRENQLFSVSFNFGKTLKHCLTISGKGKSEFGVESCCNLDWRIKIKLCRVTIACRPITRSSFATHLNIPIKTSSNNSFEILNANFLNNHNVLRIKILFKE